MDGLQWTLAWTSDLTITLSLDTTDISILVVVLASKKTHRLDGVLHTYIADCILTSCIYCVAIGLQASSKLDLHVTITALLLQLRTQNINTQQSDRMNIIPLSLALSQSTNHPSAFAFSRASSHPKSFLSHFATLSISSFPS